MTTPPPPPEDTAPPSSIWNSADICHYFPPVPSSVLFLTSVRIVTCSLCPVGGDPARLIYAAWNSFQLL